MNGMRIVGEFTWDDNPYSVRECIEAWENSDCGDLIDQEFLYRMSGFARTYWVDELESAYLVDCLVLAGLAESKGEAKKFIKGGAVKMNGLRCCNEKKQVVSDHDDLLYGRYLVLKLGKASLCILIQNPK